MRVSAVAAVLSLFSFSAFAAEITAKVTFDNEPVVDARVRIFAEAARSLPGCEAAPEVRDRLFGKCLCPGQVEQTVARLHSLAAKPVATTTSKDGGVIRATLDGPGPWHARIVSADGRAIAEGRFFTGAELTLRRVPSLKVALNGNLEGATAHFLDWETHEILELLIENGAVSVPPHLSSRTLLISGPTAVPLRIPFSSGRSLIPNPLEDRVVFSLLAPVPIRGVVVDQGRPAGNVEVISDPARCAIRTRTNAKGEFDLAITEAPPFLSTVVARRGSDRIAYSHVNAGQRIELALQPSRTLELVFVDASGKPVPGVATRINAEFGPNEELVSAADGKVKIDGLVSRVNLHVRAPWVIRGERKIALEKSRRVAVTVDKGEPLSGRVLTAEGSPARYVFVKLQYPPGAQPTDSMKESLAERYATTDDQGAFTIPGVLPGEYEVVASTSDRSETKANVTVPGAIELKLQKPIVIEGEVLELGTNKPLGGAHVNALIRQPSHHSYGAITNEQGRFRIVVETPGTYEVTATGPIGGKPETATAKAERGGSGFVRFSLTRAAEISGTLVDADGKPVAGVTLEALSPMLPQLMMRQPGAPPIDPKALVPMAKMMRGHYATVTGADGTFSFPTSGAVFVFGASAGGQVALQKIVPNAPNQLVMKRPSIVRGRVVDESGKPVERVMLNHLVTLAPGGKFEWVVPGTGPTELQIASDTSPPKVVPITPPEPPGPIDLGEVRLAKGLSLAGVVLAADTQKPLPHVILALKTNGRSVNEVCQSDGSFNASNLDAGPVELIVTADGHAAQAVKTTSGNRQVKVLMQKYATLEIIGAQRGTPIEGVELEAEGPPRADYPLNKRSARTDSDGRTVMKEITPGEWKITVRDGKTTTVRLKPGETKLVQLAL